MTDPERFHTPPGIEPSELLDQVMRGERFIGLPPGTFLASLFIPCLCVAAVCLGYLAAVLVFPSPTIDMFALMMTIGLLIVSIAIVGQVLVFYGRSQFHHRLRIYMRVLWYLMLVIAPAAAFFGQQDVRYDFMLVGGASMFGCTAIIKSRSYLAIASFMALKRKYRLAARQHAKEVLARARARSMS